MDSFFSQQGTEDSYGDRLVGRVMAAEYNLAEQRGDQQQAGRVLGLMIGQFLQRLFTNR